MLAECERYVNIDRMKMKSLHYVLLAGIDTTPSSGYDLKLWLANLGRHFWAAEHNSIYPALQQLHVAGFITYREQLGQKGQIRKVYRLSAKGRKELKKWVDEPSDDAQIRDEQMVKVLCFDLLPRERVIAHLQRIRERHAAKLSYYEDLLQLHRENPPKEIKLGPLLTLNRGILAAKTYVQWCDEALLLVAKDTYTSDIV